MGPVSRYLYQSDGIDRKDHLADGINREWDMTNIASIYSPTFETEDSYGRIATRLFEQLCARDMFVNTVGKFPLEKRFRPIAGGIHLGYPTNRAIFGELANTGPIVQVTMFESDALPSDWIKPLNESSVIVVPSPWQEQMFRTQGVDRKIVVAPLGIDPVFKPIERRHREGATFVCIGDRGLRKGWFDACRAFAIAFKDDPNYTLIVKCRKEAHFPIKPVNPNIIIFEEDLSEAELAAFYGECDAMIFPSQGEGFGLPPREFAATGGVAFATYWGPLKDDVSLWGFPIECSEGEAWKGHKFKGIGKWAVPSVEHLVSQLRYFAEHKRVFLDRAYRKAERVAEHYQWETFGEIVYHAWNACTYSKVGYASNG